MLLSCVMFVKQWSSCDVWWMLKVDALETVTCLVYIRRKHMWPFFPTMNHMTVTWPAAHRFMWQSHHVFRLWSSTYTTSSLLHVFLNLWAGTVDLDSLLCQNSYKLQSFWRQKTRPQKFQSFDPKIKLWVPFLLWVPMHTLRWFVSVSILGYHLTKSITKKLPSE